MLDTIPQGQWMQTYTGRAFTPLDPNPEDIDIDDIAHALSMICRYNGHCSDFYSVAQHSVYVSWHLPGHLALQGLLHDAAEAYLGDIIRPLKGCMTAYCSAEDRLQSVINRAFGLPLVLDPLVKTIDNAILGDEARCLMGKPPARWHLPVKPLGIQIVPWSQKTAKDLFLTRFRELTHA